MVETALGDGKLSASRAWPGPAAALAAAAALVVYRLSLAPDLTWANAAIDGVELITASATLGVPHPPGYPTYVLLGKLFSLLPVGSVPFRYNLFSAVTTASAVGLVVLSIAALHPRIRPAAAVAAALLFGLAPLVWSQAVVAEIYGLNLLLIALFLLTIARRGDPAWSGFWFGLALTTHLTSLFLLPALLVRGGGRPWRAPAGVAAGLSPLLLLPLLAAGSSPIVWGDATNPAGWWWLVSGRLYAANVQPGLDAGHLRQLLQALLFGPAALVASGSAGRAKRKDAATVSNTSRPTLIALGASALLYVLFAATYRTPDAAVLLLPALLVGAVLLAPALNRLNWAALTLPVALVWLTFSARDLSHDAGARAMGMQLLDAAPPNALLLTPGDRTIFVLHYFQQVEGRRADLRVADSNLFAFDWYRSRLAAMHPDIYVPGGDELPAFQSANQGDRPFCVASLVSASMQFPSGERTPPAKGSSPPYIDCQEETH